MTGYQESKIHLLASFCILALLLVSFGTPRAHAETTPTQVGLSISPPTYELTANPGDNLTEAIRLSNLSSDTVTYESAVEDFKVGGTEGQVTLSPDDSANAFSKWFNVTPKQITLNPRESRSVNFTISSPVTAEPGSHFASLLFQPKVVATSRGATGAQVIQRVGALILLNIKGSSTEKATLENFSTKTYVGEWDQVLGSDNKTSITVPKNELLENEHAASYFSTGPIGFQLLFKNEGNVHIKPTGTISIYNLFNQKVAEFPIDGRNVFPQGERRITAIWPESKLWGGYYRAHLFTVYGSKNLSLTAETHFFAFPSTPLWIIIGSLVILILVRKRLVAAIRVLVKGS